jgi:hypothetical protein
VSETGPAGLGPGGKGIVMADKRISPKPPVGQKTSDQEASPGVSKTSAKKLGRKKLGHKKLGHKKLGH